MRQQFRFIKVPIGARDHMNHALALANVLSPSKSTFVELDDCQNCQLTGLNLARPKSLNHGLGPRDGIELLLGLFNMPIHSALAKTQDGRDLPA